MKPCYVIVHQGSIGVEGEIWQEIMRIRYEEEWVAVDGYERIVPSGIPPNRQIYVCGAYL